MSFSFSFDTIKQSIQDTLDDPRTFDTIGSAMTNSVASVFKRLDDKTQAAIRSPSTPMSEAAMNYAKGANNAEQTGGFNISGGVGPLIAIAAVGFLLWRLS